jgi:hypothetical protein
MRMWAGTTLVVMGLVGCAPNLQTSREGIPSVAAQGAPPPSVRYPPGGCFNLEGRLEELNLKLLKEAIRHLTSTHEMMMANRRDGDRAILSELEFALKVLTEVEQSMTVLAKVRAAKGSQDQ